MITVWGQPMLTSVPDIIDTLRLELHAGGSELLRDMKMTTGNIMVTCPFHAEGLERKPSCGVSINETREGTKVYDAGTVHCFTCGYTGDIPKMVSDIMGKNDGGQSGYKWLTSKFASVTVENREPLQLNLDRGKSRAERRKTLESATVEYVSEEELESYRYVHDYMYFRKLTDKVIEYFDVGYDQATNSLTFPVKDLTGRALFVQRRAIAAKSFLNEKTPKGKVVYGLHEVYANLEWIEEVFIVESIIDALTLWTYRIPAVATLGVMPTAIQIELIKACPVRTWIVAYDNPKEDQAGADGYLRLKNALERHKMLKYMEYPEGIKDPNDMTPEQLTTIKRTNQPYFLKYVSPAQDVNFF